MNTRGRRGALRGPSTVSRDSAIESPRMQEHGSASSNSVSLCSAPMGQPTSIPSSTSERGHESQSISHAGSNEGTTSSQRRGRGSAKPWKGWGKEQKILEWNENFQPIGDDATQLATQLGYFARQGNLFPLDVPSWDKMDKHRLNTIWENVQGNTNAPDGYKDRCLMKIGLQWKRFKSDLKDRYYNKFQTDDERLANAPPHVDDNQWKYLVEYWGTEKAQQVASKNSENRANLCCYPKTGKKSFARVKEEMKTKGLQTDQMSVWLYTRKKNESYSDTDGSADKEEMIKRMLEELPEDQQNDEEVRNKIFEEVIGSDAHGRCLCVGVDIRPAPKRSRPLSSSSQHQDEIAKLRKEAEEREIHHQEEIDNLRKEAKDREDKVREETDEKINKSKEFLINLIRQAGLSVPDDILNS